MTAVHRRRVDPSTIASQDQPVHPACPRAMKTAISACPVAPFRLCGHEAVRSDADSPGGEQGNRCGGHECRGEPSEDAGGVAVHVAAHDAAAARYSHDHDEEGCGGHAVDDRHEDKQLDRVDVQEAQRGAADRAQGDELKGEAPGARDPGTSLASLLARRSTAH
jgi:hypothetical protein